MKKNILICAIMLVAAQMVFAMPAKKGKFVKVQPDGTTITLQRHGDEFFHWTTREDGTVVALDANGFYVPASLPTQERLGGRKLADMEAAAIRAKRAASNQLQMASGTYKTYHFPVVLVQFSDVKFTSETANNDFYRLLNEEGYSDNGGTGSVRDFYWENSMGTFLAEFDVFGPYTYDGACADNADENDAAKILWDAIEKNDSLVDWSKYDNDGDGSVDMVFMYYAGYNEAEGADNTIWPHKYNFSYAGTTTGTLDGKSFDVYACTSELKGTSGSNMCGIGTCAHEFSHTQGLPDFYDVNYDNYGDGETGATYAYDIMCSGGYNNSGRTPPYFTAEERIMMGWLEGYEDIPASGSFTIPSVNNNVAYRLETTNTSGQGEYFVFECRSGQGWDAYLEPGLIVYHADKSTKYNVTIRLPYDDAGNIRSYTFTPYQLWTNYSQYVNASGSHPCFYIVPAADQENLNYSGPTANLPFPGASRLTFYQPTDWAGNGYGLFNDIAFHSDGTYVSLNRTDNFSGFSGLVTNTSGEALAGAKVNLYATSASSNIISGPERISGRIIGNLKASVTTDETGQYSFNLEELGLSSLSTVDIEVVASGYITKYEVVTVPEVLLAQNFTMRGINEPISYTLRKFGALDEIYGLGYGNTCNSYASIKLTADELSPYVGRKILSLSFAYSTGESGSVSKVYGIIDAGGSRVLTSQVSNPTDGAWNTIDLSSNDLYVEAGKDYNFGYGLLNCTYGYPMLFSREESKDGGFNYYLTSASTNVEGSSFTWNETTSGNLLIYVVLDSSSEVDYNYIYNPGYGNYKVGDTFALTLVEAEGNRKPGTDVKWFFDDEPVSGEGIVLKYAGYHVVEARFTTTDGKTKVLELEINVNL